MVIIIFITKRNNTYYIISAGAGANIYSLKREKEALKDDVYYGKRIDEELKRGVIPYEFKASDGTITNIPKAM